MAAPVNELVRGLDETELAKRVRALTVLAACAGQKTAAAKLLRQQGVRVSESTLVRWRERHPDVYDRAQVEVAEALEQRMAGQHRELGLRALELTDLALTEFESAADQLTADQAARAARDLVHVADTAAKTMLTLTGRPSEITETRSVQEIGRSLAERFPNVVTVEGTAEELDGGAE